MASSLVQFRTEDTSRIKAASICEQLGIDLPTYLRACIARLIQENGIPFSMKLEPKPENKGLQAMKEASRIAAEMGAQFVKTYFVEEGFEKVTASCPVPIVIAGGKKLPEQEALEMCWRAIDQGASGVDMGRNIFQSSAPRAMLKAVKKVVHENLSAREAYQFWQEEKQGELQ